MYLAISELHVTAVIPWYVFFYSGKNFLRPNDMNINVATWGRLMKHALPSQCADGTGALSPQPGIYFL